MPHEFIQEPVDIFKLPVVDDKYKGDKDAGAEITIGDLHGNAIKLMFMLIKHGVVTGINEEQYTQLVDIYLKHVDTLTKADLGQFNAILDSATFNRTAFIRLLGDDFGDRGSNDYFTLKIFEKLHKSNMPFEVILSNHSIEFVEASEKQENFNLVLLNFMHARSMQNMQRLLEKGIITHQETLDAVVTRYQPTAQCI